MSVARIALGAMVGGFGGATYLSVRQIYFAKSLNKEIKTKSPLYIVAKPVIIGATIGAIAGAAGVF